MCYTITQQAVLPPESVQMNRIVRLPHVSKTESISVVAFAHSFFMPSCVNCAACAIPVALLCYRLCANHPVQTCLFAFSYLLCCATYVYNKIHVGNGSVLVTRLGKPNVQTHPSASSEQRLLHRVVVAHNSDDGFALPAGPWISPALLDYDLL